MLKRRQVGDDALRSFFLRDANGMQPFSSQLSKDFSLGSREVSPAAILWFQSFTYFMQWQTCREMTLHLQGQLSALQVCGEGFSSDAQHCHWVWFPPHGVSR